MEFHKGNDGIGNCGKNDISLYVSSKNFAGTVFEMLQILLIQGTMPIRKMAD